MDGLLMENPLKMDDLGVPLFSETSIFIHPIYSSSLWISLDFIQEACSSFWSTPIEEVSIAPQKILPEPISSPGPKKSPKVPGAFWLARGKTPEISWNSQTFKTEKTSGRLIYLGTWSSFLKPLWFWFIAWQVHKCHNWEFLCRLPMNCKAWRNTPVLVIGIWQMGPPICSGGKIRKKLLRRFRRSNDCSGFFRDTHQEINMSHLGNRKIIFKSTFKMGYVSSQEGTNQDLNCFCFHSTADHPLQGLWKYTMTECKLDVSFNQNITKKVIWIQKCYLNSMLVTSSCHFINSLIFHVPRIVGKTIFWCPTDLSRP